MTMIERVARALHSRVDDRLWTDPRVAMLERDEWRDLARAAIEAMREPTEAMVDRFVSRALCVSVHGDGGWSAYAREQWQAMIDAALVPPPHQP
jgi:hypothetical protein